jgi:hypothetical protein
VVLGQRQVVAVVDLADGVDVSGAGETLGRVGADRVQHRQPGGRVRVLAADEKALGRQAVERVEGGVCDRFGGLDRCAPGENSEA